MIQQLRELAEADPFQPGSPGNSQPPNPARPAPTPPTMCLVRRNHSVILGIRSYEEVRGDAHAQTMQQAIRSLKTLLFVGCREGLLDRTSERC
jgi:hypothetical protein